MRIKYGLQQIGTAVAEQGGIHGHLMKIGYRSNLTALHFLMTIGLQVIKPDIVISKLFLDWGWLHKIIPELPQDVCFDDLRGKGKYGSRFQYTSEKMYKPAINLARQIVAITKREDLEKDIGWVTGNPIREFDVFTVKYGQKPEKDFGVERTLYESPTTPVNEKSTESREFCAHGLDLPKCGSQQDEGGAGSKIS